MIMYCAARFIPGVGQGRGDWWWGHCGRQPLPGLGAGPLCTVAASALLALQRPGRHKGSHCSRGLCGLVEAVLGNATRCLCCSRSTSCRAGSALRIPLHALIHA